MSKPRPILPHMPWNVKKLIVESGNTVTKIALRSALKEFKDVVSQCQIRYKDLHLGIDPVDRHASIEFVPHQRSFTSVGYIDHDGKSRIKVKNVRDKAKVSEDNEEVFERNGNFLEVALNQFVKVIRKKVVIESSKIEFYDSLGESSVDVKNQVLDTLHTSISSLPNPVCIESLNLSFFERLNQSDILKVLPYIKPRTLKRIQLEKPHKSETTEKLDLCEVAETEQWKLAEQLWLEGYSITLPVEKWSHFKRVNVEVHELTVSKMKVIYNSFLNSSQWRYCSVGHGSLGYEDLDVEPFVEYFSQLGSHTTKWDEHKFKITIPNSEKPLIVEIMCSCIFLDKDCGF